MMKIMNIADMTAVNAGGTYYCKYSKYGCGRSFTYSDKSWLKWQKNFAKFCRDQHQKFCSYRGYNDSFHW